MPRDDNSGRGTAPHGSDWYDLFSRGARDWLRHNEKVRESVRQRLPELIAGADIISRPENRTVRVPVRFLEHYRLRLKERDSHPGVGQAQPGEVKPRDVLRQAQDGAGMAGKGAGTEVGGVQLLLELKVDDIVDWLWDELELPNLEPKPGDTLVDEQLVREGWDRRGARSRLDRRRTLKEAIKRRSVQEDGPDFTNEDLRFRQLARRRRPATNAVVFFLLDASSSMEEADRKLAKAFFFWALQGLRRQYLHISTVFIAHTATAWEFSEEEFFQVRAQGGTQASSAFGLALEVLQARYHPVRYNGYLFYASDGDNFIEDREPSEMSLRRLASLLNFVGYVEIAHSLRDALDTQMGSLFSAMPNAGLPVGSFPLSGYEDIWPGIKRFFSHQASLRPA
jgi:uncharacterized sporulation protein YeaH/YhbH (DUF444 family)